MGPRKSFIQFNKLLCQLEALLFGNNDPADQIGNGKGNDPGRQADKDEQKPEECRIDVEHLPKAPKYASDLLVFLRAVDSFHFKIL